MLFFALITPKTYILSLYLKQLGFCRKLSKLRLDVSSIKTLDLSMLGIADLYIQAPSLSDLNLSGCVDLKEDGTYLICPNLRTVDISGCNLGSGFEKEYLLMGGNNSVVDGGGSGSAADGTIQVERKLMF